MEYGNKYGLALYEQYSQNMIKEVENNWFQNKIKESLSAEECIHTIKNKYSTQKLSEFQEDYKQYMGQLVERSSI